MLLYCWEDASKQIVKQGVSDTTGRSSCKTTAVPGGVANCAVNLPDTVACDRYTVSPQKCDYIFYKKAMLSQGNRAMPL